MIRLPVSLAAAALIGVPIVSWTATKPVDCAPDNDGLKLAPGLCAILIADSTAKAIPALARLGGVDLETSGLKVFISRDYEPKPMRHYRSTR